MSQPVKTSACPKLETCPFFQKFGPDLQDTCKALIGIYCRGPMQGQCKRLDFRIVNGYRPPDDMMPNGDWLIG